MDYLNSISKKNKSSINTNSNSDIDSNSNSNSDSNSDSDSSSIISSIVDEGLRCLLATFSALGSVLTLELPPNRAGSSLGGIIICIINHGRCLTIGA